MHKGMTGRQGEEGPGSVGFDRHPYLKTSTAPPIQTLGDYISRVEKEEGIKKLKFHEWYRENKDKISYNYEMALFIWKEAQENK